jgi:hypothetical protein
MQNNSLSQSLKATRKKLDLEMSKIQQIIPDASNQAIGVFMKIHDVGLTTVRIWAEQGVLVFKDGAIYKMSAPSRSKEEIEIAVNAIKRLSVFRCGAIFSFQDGSFSSDWTGSQWILSFVDVDKNLAHLRRLNDEKMQIMKMESLYTAWLNQCAVIEGYDD